jgi:hypothetical protein
MVEVAALATAVCPKVSLRNSLKYQSTLSSHEVDGIGGMMPIACQPPPLFAYSITELPEEPSCA